MHPRADGGLHDRLLWPCLLWSGLLWPSLLGRLLLRPTLLLLPWLGLRGRRLLRRRRLWRWLWLPLSKRSADGGHRLRERGCFFRCGRRNEFGKGHNAVTVRIGFGMEGRRLFYGGTGGLSQLFNIQRTAVVLVSSDEVFRSAHERLFILHRGLGLERHIGA